MYHIHVCNVCLFLQFDAMFLHFSFTACETERALETQVCESNVGCDCDDNKQEYLIKWTFDLISRSPGHEPNIFLHLKRFAAFEFLF